jgi:hypothetical protein
LEIEIVDLNDLVPLIGLTDRLSLTVPRNEKPDDREKEKNPIHLKIPSIMVGRKPITHNVSAKRWNEHN